MNDYRPVLFSVAYNMLGNRSDAEDVVQDVLLKWEQSSKANIHNHEAYLVKSTVNTAINHLTAAHRRRLTYPGISLPEPLPDEMTLETGADGEVRTMLTYELMVLAREIPPAQLAVFVLKEAFSYSHEEIAQLLDKRVDYCRQLYKRAKDTIHTLDPPTQPHTESDLKLAGEVVEAIVQGDVRRLTTLLAPDVRLMADGGGRVAASPSPTIGSDKVAHLLTTAARKAGFVPRIEILRINGQPGFVAYKDKEPVAAYVLTPRKGKIRRLYVILNPEKLRAFKRT